MRGEFWETALMLGVLLLALFYALSSNAHSVKEYSDHIDFRIEGLITTDKMNAIYRKLYYMSTDKPIYIRVASAGGEMTGAARVARYIERNFEVRIAIAEYSYSTGTLMWLLGNKTRKFAFDDSFVHFHKCYVAGRGEDQSTCQKGGRVYESMKRFIMRHTGWSERKVEIDALTGENYFYYKRARKEGLIK